MCCIITINNNNNLICIIKRTAAYLVMVFHIVIIRVEYNFCICCAFNADNVLSPKYQQQKQKKKNGFLVSHHIYPLPPPPPFPLHSSHVFILHKLLMVVDKVDIRIGVE